MGNFIERIKAQLFTNEYFEQWAKAGDIKSLKAALKARANINYRNDEGVTPLIQAISAGHEDAALFLLDQGADHEIRTNEGWRAYDFAKNSNLLSVTKRLLALHGGKPPL